MGENGLVAARDGRGWGTRTFWAGGDVCTLRALSDKCMQLSKLSESTLKIHAFHCEILHQEKKQQTKIINDICS